ncbi:MAG: hypothetical protein AAF211_21020, partial [Myxococcota bacterium]
PPPSDLGIQTTATRVGKPKMRRTGRPWSPEQRRQVTAIVLMLLLAGGMGFVVLGLSLLL